GTCHLIRNQATMGNGTRHTIIVRYYISYTLSSWYCFFFFNDPATIEIYTLSLHDALPISARLRVSLSPLTPRWANSAVTSSTWRDRKSTRLNSSHVSISYAVFCLKKKKKNKKTKTTQYKKL